jgi:hypothetical protein
VNTDTKNPGRQNRASAENGGGAYRALIFIAAATLVVALSVASLVLGDLNQDEGWYLYAAGLVSGGALPYEDFAFTQGPVMPFVYSLLWPAIDTWGVFAGRLFSSLLFCLCCGGVCLLSAGMVRRGLRLPAAFLGLVLTGVNAYQSYFSSVVKTYSLSSLLLVTGFLALMGAVKGRTRLWGAVSGLLFGLAAATRLSAGIVLPVAGAYLVVLHCLSVRREEYGGGPGNNKWTWVLFGAGGAAALAICFAPFFIFSADNARFWLMEYHTAREVDNWIKALMLKAGSLSRLIGSYFVGFSVLLCAVAWKLGIARRRIFSGAAGRKKEPGFTRMSHKIPAASADSTTARARIGKTPYCRMPIRLLRRFTNPHPRSSTLHALPPHGGQAATKFCEICGFAVCLWLGVISIALVHFSAPFPYDEYQVMVYPLFAAALAAFVVRILTAAKAWAVCLVVLLVSVASVFSSPIVQNWYVLEIDRLWVRMKEEPPLARLQEAGQLVENLAPRGSKLLTQDVYLAVESGMVLPHGLELGQFSYFPGFSTERARELNVLNRPMMEKLLLKSEAPVAAFSGYGLAVRSPQVTQLETPHRKELFDIVESRYRLFRTIPDFGQAYTTLRVYLKK